MTSRGSGDKKWFKIELLHHKKPINTFFYSAVSSASTTPYVDEPYVIQFSTSTSTSMSTIRLDSEDNDEEDKDVTPPSLETHFFIADQSPAPFSKSFKEEEVSQHCHEMISILLKLKQGRIHKSITRMWWAQAVIRFWQLFGKNFNSVTDQPTDLPTEWQRVDCMQLKMPNYWHIGQPVSYDSLQSEQKMFCLNKFMIVKPVFASLRVSSKESMMEQRQRRHC